MLCLLWPKLRAMPREAEDQDTSSCFQTMIESVQNAGRLFSDAVVLSSKHEVRVSCKSGNDMGAHPLLFSQQRRRSTLSDGTVSILMQSPGETARNGRQPMHEIVIPGALTVLFHLFLETCSGNNPSAMRPAGCYWTLLVSDLAWSKVYEDYVDSSRRKNNRLRAK